MKIIVCVKQVPDTATKIVIKEDSKEINTDQVQFVLNPYDEFAVEEALRIKDRKEGTEVTVITIGPDRAREAIRTALAMGADRAYHVQDDALTGSDNYVTSSIIAQLIAGMEYDLILCGKQAVDDDAFFVSQSLAEMSGIPHVSVITELSFSEDFHSATVKRQVEGGSDIVEVPLPALFTCQKDLNIPRLPSMKGIMSIKKKEVIKLDLAGVGLEKNQVGEEGSLVKTVSLTLPPERGGGKILKGTGEETTKELVRLLREEAKVV
ncbi:MAG: electron transfer flavoprotein subunit beta/FixA family protein [Nitrospinota bacterium]|jgi:electron transfer flavoprotein beta subunit|nr:electron transfer flavoprotein subunit beta/FixA family protein [Nitrospinota bacterium]